MSVIRKLRSIATLCLRGDLSGLRKSYLRNSALHRVKKHGERPFVHQDLGYPAVCFPDWHDSLHQFLYNAGDHWEMSLFHQWLEPGDYVIDMGASLGLYALGFADAVGTTGKVVAVDADGFAIDKLHQSMALTGVQQIVPLHAAVTERRGAITFYMRRDRRDTAEQSLVPSAATKQFCDEVKVDAVTVSDLIAVTGDAERVALCKVDVEGAEVGLLRATPQDMLGDRAPLWQVEIHPGALARFGNKPNEVTEFFKADYFDRWLMPKHPLPHSARGTSLRMLDPDEKFDDSLYYNFIAVPLSERWSLRRERLNASLHIGDKN